MTCPDVASDPVLTLGEDYSVPVVHHSSELLDTDRFIVCILYYSEKITK